MIYFPSIFTASFLLVCIFHLCIHCLQINFYVDSARGTPSSRPANNQITSNLFQAQNQIPRDRRSPVVRGSSWVVRGSNWECENKTFVSLANTGPKEPADSIELREQNINFGALFRSLDGGVFERLMQTTEVWFGTEANAVFYCHRNSISATCSNIISFIEI